MSDNRTILLVDDVPIFRELGALFLARAGRVVTAQSGDEALEIARREKPDLMLVDLLMPDLKGDDVCRFVKSDPDLHDIPVIMLVGDDSSSDWGRAVRSGANDVLAKPLCRVALNETVNRFLRGGTPVGSPRIDIDMPVELKLGSQTREGRLRNLSRGGVFVETECYTQEDSELGLSFVLPETESEITPTAQVIWRRRNRDTATGNGIGMRFVDITGTSIRTLEDYVYGRAIESPADLPGASP
jgi:CheY-like chemotaxis protein/Tfp pilus assembly protein PilZ